MLCEQVHCLDEEWNHFFHSSGFFSDSVLSKRYNNNFLIIAIMEHPPYLPDLARVTFFFSLKLNLSLKKYILSQLMQIRKWQMC